MVKRNNKLISYHIKSSIWTSIKEYDNLVLDNSKWLIGNGSRINFWLDTWLDEPLVDKFKIPASFHKSINVMVKAWLVDKAWCIPTNVQAVFPNLLLMLSVIKIPDMEVEDSII